MEAATAARSTLIRLNTLHCRRRLGADVVETAEKSEFEDTYYAARSAIRQVSGLLDLSGPDELAAGARSVRKADRELGMVRFVAEKTSGSERYTLPPMVRQAADAMEAEVRAFVEVAHQCVR